MGGWGAGHQAIGSPINVGDGPYGVAVDQPRAHAYVANFSAGTVSAINTLTNQVIGTPINVGNNPIGVAIVGY